MVESTSIVSGLSLPNEVKGYLDEMVDSLKESAGDNLVSIIVYGSIARGHYRPKQSDVNLLLVLHNVAAIELDKVEKPLRTAKRSLNVNAMIMTEKEIKRASDVFPVKFMHVKNYNVLLHGKELFENLEISPVHIRIRLEQELRNVSIRLRNQYVSLHKDNITSVKMISSLMGSLAVQLRTLLELAGKPLPTEHTSSAYLEAAADAFDLDKEALDEACSLRHAVHAKADIDDIFARLMVTVDKVVEIADRLDVAK